MNVKQLKERILELLQSGRFRVNDVMTDSISVVSEDYKIQIVYGDYNSHMDKLTISYGKGLYIVDDIIEEYPEDDDCPYQQMVIGNVVDDVTGVDFNIRGELISIATHKSLVNEDLAKSFDSTFNQLVAVFDNDIKGE